MIHISKGESSERYIEVRKPQHETTDVSASSLSVHSHKVSSSERTKDTDPGQSYVNPPQQLSSSDCAKDAHPVLPSVDTPQQLSSDALPGHPGHASGYVCGHVSSMNPGNQKDLDLSISVQQCGVCGKQIPVSNWQLHTLKCTREPSNKTTQVD